MTAAYIATPRQFVRNVGSGYALLAAEVLVAFFLTPFIITRLGAASYGVLSLMLSVIGYMGLIDVGIRGSVGRYINHYLALKDHDALSQVVGTAVTVLSLLSLAAGVAAVGIGLNFERLFPKTPSELVGDIAIALPLLAVGLWLSFVSSIAGNLLAAKEQMYLTNAFGLLVLVMRSIAIVAVLSTGHGILAVVIVNLVTAAISLVLALWAVGRSYRGEVPRIADFNADRLREIWRFGIASFTARTAATMANDSAPLIGMWLLGPEAVAVYSVAMTLTQNARRLSELANSAIFPSVMKAGAVKDFAMLRNMYIRFMDVSFAIGSLVFIGLIVFGAPFLRLWVGPTYAAAADVISIMSVGYLVQSISSTSALTLASLDRVGVTVKIALAEAIGCVVLTAALPGLFGLGLAGMALGATLPRMVSTGFLYPWLGIEAMGSELRPAMWRAIGRNALLCAGIAMLFYGVLYLMPTNTWPSLIVAVALITVLHIAITASRLESVPVVGKLGRHVAGWTQRLWSHGS